MIKILIIMEKFHSPGNPTNNESNLVNSFKCSGLGECSVFYIDPTELWSSSSIDNVLMSNEFDLAVVSIYHHLPSPEIARKLHKKMCYLWWDGSISLQGMINTAQEHLTPQICFDMGKGEEYESNDNFGGIFCLEVPQDTELFKPDKNVIQDLDVSFIGSIDNYRWDRAETINKIRSYGINVFAKGGRGQGYDNLSIEEYANVFRRSKICLNLSYNHGGRPQRKGRSFEIAASGSGLMFCNNPEVFYGKEGKFFEEYVDYVPFNNDNLVDQLRYYLDHEDLRQSMVKNCYNKYIENYSPVHFWKKIYKICKKENLLY